MGVGLDTSQQQTPTVLHNYFFNLADELRESVLSKKNLKKLQEEHKCLWASRSRQLPANILLSCMLEFSTIPKCNFGQIVKKSSRCDGFSVCHVKVILEWSTGGFKQGWFPLTAG